MCLKGNYVGNQMLEDDVRQMKNLLVSIKKCEELTKETTKCYAGIKKILIDNSQAFINTLKQTNVRSNAASNIQEIVHSLTQEAEFMRYNDQINDVTLKPLALLTNEVRSLQKMLDELRKKQRSYESALKKLHKTEAKYANNSKPLSESATYNKGVAERDKLKTSLKEMQTAYEARKKDIMKELHNVMANAHDQYLRANATFSQALTVTLTHTNLSMESNDSNAVNPLRASMRAHPE